MPEKTDKQIRDYVKDKVENALAVFGLSKVYSDYEILDDISKLEQGVGILHKGVSELVETKGTGVAEYITEYTIVVIVHRGIRNVSFNSEKNEERLDNLVTRVGSVLLVDNQSSDCPYSQPAVISSYGLGNQEDPLGLPGGEEKSWKNLLVLYCTVNIFHRRIF